MAHPCICTCAQPTHIPACPNGPPMHPHDHPWPTLAPTRQHAHLPLMHPAHAAQHMATHGSTHPPTYIHMPTHAHAATHAPTHVTGHESAATHGHATSVHLHQYVNTTHTCSRTSAWHVWGRRMMGEHGAGQVWVHMHVQLLPM